MIQQESIHFILNSTDNTYMVLTFQLKQLNKKVYTLYILNSTANTYVWGGLTSASTDPHQVSEDFRAVLRASACSPWRFPGLLAHSFGCDVVPPGRYNTLKLALLLSLVQTGPDTADTTFHSLDLLALASDTLLIDR